MRLAIMGAGALGCYFGGRLAAAGNNVTFIARGKQLEALKTDGLRIESPLGDLHLPEVRATDNPSEVGKVDLILFLVKLYDTEVAANALLSMLTPKTAIVSLQNGVDGWQRIGEIAGQERVVGGTAVIPADLRAPGIVRHNGPFARLTIGAFKGNDSEPGAILASLFKKADVDASVVPDIEVKIWEKFIVLSALSAVTALTRLSLGPVRRDPISAKLFERALQETIAVGRAACPELSEESISRATSLARSLPDNMRASMLDDLERGKPLELDDLSGAVVRHAADHGIDVPVHETVWRALHPFVLGSDNH